MTAQEPCRMTNKRLYRRTYYPLEYPLNGAIRVSAMPVAYGSWMPGVETVRVINGLHVPVVRLPDGTEEPLSELTFKYDQRKVERPKGFLERLLDFMIARRQSLEGLCTT